MLRAVVHEELVKSVDVQVDEPGRQAGSAGVDAHVRRARRLLSRLADGDDAPRGDVDRAAGDEIVPADDDGVFNGQRHVIHHVGEL